MPWGLKSPKGSLTLPFRKRNRYVINEPEPSYQVIYLGNVLTMMAKGDACVEKPLALIWKTHLARTRPDLPMRLCVAKSGLKAETKLQGLTEYWSHRITFCVAPPGYPRVFCWIYKHEGKKMKPELRCHAVLCRKASEPAALADRLSQSLASALAEYRREKLSRQNSRMAAQLAGQANGLPARKAILSTGTSNFRPPISRSKSAPKLGMIEEGAEEDEDEEEDEDIGELLNLTPSLSLHNGSLASEECASVNSSDCVVEGLSEGMGDSPRSSASSQGSASSFPLHPDQAGPSTSAASEPGDRLVGEGSESPVAPPRLHRLHSLPCSLQASPRLASSGGDEADSISDESGYHEEKASLESASDDGADAQSPATPTRPAQSPPSPPSQPHSPHSSHPLSVAPREPDVTITAF